MKMRGGYYYQHISAFLSESSVDDVRRAPFSVKSHCPAAAAVRSHAAVQRQLRLPSGNEQM